MYRFADIRTDTDFHRLLKFLMVESVFTVCRRMREVIRSVHVVVAVGKYGMQLHVDACCVEMRAVSFVTCVERFCPEIFKWFTATFLTTPWDS